MIPWLSVLALLTCIALCGYYYIKSVGPAALAQEIGPEAYAKCARYRMIAVVWMCLSIIPYAVYMFYPLPFLPRTFPWAWWVSAVIAGLIMLPAGYVMYRGTRDAGEETLVPKPEHTLYGGIYAHIRHPQAVGEFLLTVALVLLLHSPFLLSFSILTWGPTFVWMCQAEERDLLIRYGADYQAYRVRTGMFFPKRSRR
jgi:methanethiol S-methyltransferase